MINRLITFKIYTTFSHLYIKYEIYFERYKCTAVKITRIIGTDISVEKKLIIYYKSNFIFSLEKVKKIKYSKY